MVIGENVGLEAIPGIIDSSVEFLEKWKNTHVNNKSRGSSQSKVVAILLDPPMEHKILRVVRKQASMA